MGASPNAYRQSNDLGAEVITLAVGIWRGSHARSFWRYYYRTTGDLAAHARLHTGLSFRECVRALLDHRRAEVITFFGANYAQQLASNSSLSSIPPNLRARPSIDLIHCNHFFNMPLAL